MKDVHGQNQEKQEILKRVAEYYEKYHSTSSLNQIGKKIPYAARVYDSEEMINLVDSALEFWLTAGTYSVEFERQLASFLHVNDCFLVNSGSSANLLAFMALTSPLLNERQILRGDEVITVAAGFPTTIAPIIQYGAVPVFIDVTIPEYNIDISKLNEALSSKTKAVMLAHTLGNPFDIMTVKSFCQKHNLWLIEDNCDSLGSRYLLNGQWQYTGTFGDLGTSSFYPPHHMTTGEGGAVYTNNPVLSKIILSMRDWGRDCQCQPGEDNRCNHRFEKQYGDLPKGYDHKYVYSHFGYNLKATDMQAAIGCAQLKKLPSFIQRRKDNFNRLLNNLQYSENDLILPKPTLDSDPSWFGFLITCKEINRGQLVNFLEGRGIQTRMLFAGNIVKHPCFDQVRTNKNAYKIIGNLDNTDRVMRDTFWVGVYPGMTEPLIDYISESVIKGVKVAKSL